jgi:hypothetical protein
MNCKYCDCAFRPTKLNIDPSVCLECSGVVDDLSENDDEFKIDAWKLRNPSGKTYPVFEVDNNDVFDSDCR